ncbi:MAG: rod shape-determining protein MreC [Pseudomonadota bacterium]|nr:MAG: rod shape-determining protein MreC [Pseudomonadota bacterium]
MITVFGWSLRAPSQTTRFVFFVGLSIALMVMDHRGQQLEKIRAALSVLAIPVHYVAAAPARIVNGIAEFFTGERALKESIERLRDQNAQMQVRLQQFEALEQENNRLRGMIGSAQRVADAVLAAEVLEVAPEPFTRQIVLARGEQHGVRLGQPVIDAHGIIGQITQLGPYTSRATLITDVAHAIPVLVNRNGLRAIVFGTGDPDTLKVLYLTANADIREGDLLVSSGMGGTFPPDYPVARVGKITNNPNESFLEIAAAPSAQLDYGKQVMLIRPPSPVATPTPAAPPGAPKAATAPTAKPGAAKQSVAPAPKPTQSAPAAPASNPPSATPP